MTTTSHKLFLLLLLVLVLNAPASKAQVNSLAQKITSQTTNAFTEDISGDGRFAILVSQSNLSTVPGTRNNLDGNYEVFLFDYAQRHVFQITNTKSLLINPAGSTTDPNNIRTQIYNLDVKISNDGRWIVFSSNATTSRPNAPNQTNPGNFDANSYTDPQGSNPLTQDGNMELWLYRLPNFAAVDLSSGIAPAFVDLSAGTFTPVTNTDAIVLPSGTNVSFDNIEGTINDNGCVVAFTSVHDLMPGFNADQNREIFVHERNDPTGVCQNVPGIAQVTRTPNEILSPIFNISPSLSGNGRRLAFASSANNPVIGMTSGNNPEFNAEVFYTDLADDGRPDGIKRQITFTAPPNPTVTMNILTIGGRRMSRDGRFITMESRAQLEVVNGGTAQSTYALYLYDADAPENQRFRQVGPRSADDPALGTTNPDVRREPVFSDYDQNGLPTRLLFTTRANFRADGTVPPNPAEGLNPNSVRQGQIYAYQIGSGPGTFSRLTTPATTDFAPCVVSSGTAYCARPPIAANTSRRLVYTQPLNGNLNDRFFVAALYLLTPQATTVVAPGDFNLSFKTGGSSMTVGAALPDALGLAPDMLASATLVSAYTPSVPVTTATGVSITRNFPAPIELRGASVAIDGFAAKVTANVNGRIDFIVPAEVGEGLKTLTINHNGSVFQGMVNIIRTQPDILTTQTCPCTPGARARILNVTNPAAPQTEPFTVTTQTPNGPLPTRLRLFVTGVRGVLASELTIRIGQVVIPSSSILTNATPADYPGVYTFDFTLPQELSGVGDVPIVLTVTINGQTFHSRPDATAPRVRILSNIVPNDLAVWRPSNGTWYVMSGDGGIQAAMQWGVATDQPAPGDYDGDGKTDFSVFRPSEGIWYVVRSSDNSFSATYFGTNGDQIAQADYDGDGKTDVAVFRPSTTFWYISQSSNGQMLYGQFGISTDTVVPADYDGDGRADFAIWRNSDAAFWIKRSSDNQIVGTAFGLTNDKPVIGDYDGDGRADYATWRGGNDNFWRILQSSNNEVQYVQWGVQGNDIAVQGDYDADGKTDIAVWRSSGQEVGWWYIRNSSTGQMRSVLWGIGGDIPVPAPYRR